jgi:hypothetical protein
MLPLAPFRNLPSGAPARGEDCRKTFVFRWLEVDRLDAVLDA